MPIPPLHRLPLIAAIAALCTTVTSAAPPNAPNTVDYFSIDFDELVASIQPSDIEADSNVSRSAFYQLDVTPHIVVPDNCEAYVLSSEISSDEPVSGMRLIGKKPAGQPVQGRVLLLQKADSPVDERDLASVSFDIGKTPTKTCTAKEFHRARGLHFQRLWNEDMAGSAVFRHFANESLAIAGIQPTNRGPSWPRGRNNRGIQDTIRLTSGGRAVSENLQLDRELITDKDETRPTKPISEIEGITIPEIDWKPLLSDQKTPSDQQKPVDALAELIPEDQYGVFLPNFESATTLIDQGQTLAKPAVQWFEPASRRTDVVGFYQRQLGLPINFLTRQFGGQLIGEIALTGSDPYFRTGTDLAVLLKSDNAATLHAAIQAQIQTLAVQPDLTQSIIRVGHRNVFANTTPDRHFSSYLTQIDDVVVVSNSLAQVKRIFSVADKDVIAMAALDEYLFFRQRYKKNTPQETAFVVITDAAIRKWCGPKWRISASRRTLARAVLADKTARHLETLVDGDGKSETLTANGSYHDAGRMSLINSNVLSDRFGTLQFQTPILELDIRMATESEENRYTNWRRQYQRRWRGMFDPIAIQVAVDGSSLSADISVLPLILGSDYRSFLTTVGEKRLPANTLAPADAMFSFETALDVDARTFNMARTILAGQLTFEPLSWIDDGVVAYALPNKRWEERLNARSPWRLSADDTIIDAPIAVHIPSKNNFKMTAFIVVVRAMIDQFAPNMIEWKQSKHRDVTFVSGTVQEGVPIGDADDMPTLHYVSTSQGWTLSFNDDVIRAAIDHELDANKPAKMDDKDGPQLRMKITGRAMQTSARTSSGNGLRRMCELAWNNIPILNELRRRFPDRDPITVYAEVFDQKLVDPSGGAYTWNESHQTYQSTLYGHRLHPKAGPAISPEVGPDDVIKTELTFQDNGLRAKLQWTRGEESSR